MWGKKSFNLVRFMHRINSAANRQKISELVSEVAMIRQASHDSHLLDKSKCSIWQPCGSSTMYKIIQIQVQFQSASAHCTFRFLFSSYIE